MDVFGNVWQWYALEREEDEDEEGREGHGIRRRVIFTWEGGYSSLLPPKFGWKRVGEDQELRYNIGYKFGKDDSYYQFGY